MDRLQSSFMNQQYKHLFFDLDHTLWDFDTNTREVLGDIYTQMQLAKYGVRSVEAVLDQFHLVNKVLWDQYNKGMIDKEFIRANRFLRVLQNLGVNDPKLCKEVGDYFLDHNPRRGNVIEGALDILEYLRSRYVLHILTNGFDTIQEIKMQTSGLSPFFSELITSESSGFRKPHRGFFDFSLRQTGSQAGEVIMIGDNLETDIKGARGAGIDQVYFNPYKRAHSEQVTHEISHLLQLKDIL